MTDRSLTILVHGASKSGKSFLSVTAPPPRLYLDVEAASRSLPIERVLWNPAKEKPPEPDASWIAVVPTRDWAAVDKVYQWLASGKHPFRSLIIDYISELQQRYIESVGGRSQLTMQQWGDTFRAVCRAGSGHPRPHRPPRQADGVRGDDFDDPPVGRGVATVGPRPA